MTDLIALSDESILATQAQNAFHGAHGGHPQALDVTIAKLRQAGQTDLANALFNAITAAEPLYDRINFLGNEILTANGQPAPPLAIYPYLSAPSLNARIAKVGTSTHPAYLSFGASAMLDERVIAEPNAGAETVTVAGRSFPSYGNGNTRTLKWNYVIRRKGQPDRTIVIWNGGSGPYVSYLHACALNLQTLAGRDNVADKPELLTIVEELLYDVLEYQSNLWVLADSIKALGNATFSESVPADVKKRYPGYATLHFADGSSRRV